MPSCAVSHCKNYNKSTKGTDIKYFRFPKDEQLSKEWVAACGRGDQINLKNASICSIHFDSGCFEDFSVRLQLMKTPPKSLRTLKLDAIPTLYLTVRTSNTPKRSGQQAKRRQDHRVTSLREQGAKKQATERLEVKEEKVHEQASKKKATGILEVKEEKIDEENEN